MFEATQPEAVETANQPDISGAEQGAAGYDGDAFMTVRYNKEDMPLSKEAAVTYAQKGMNYDKLSARLEEANARLSEYGGFMDTARQYAERSGRSQDEVLSIMQQYLDTGLDENAAKQAAVDQQLDAFMRRNPGIDPLALPAKVLDQWRQGVPLSEAYWAHQAGQHGARARMLERVVSQHRTNAKNAAATMGSAKSSGPTHGRPINDEAIRNMTPEELEKNHSRIWTYLTGEKQ